MAINNEQSHEKSVRLRFAPSPTGYLHVGGARTALFNYLFTKSMGGVFIVRIEDTDQKRSNQEAVKQLLSSLYWLGVHWDEGPEIKIIDDHQLEIVGEIGDYGPYFQSKRFSLYDKFIFKLVEEGKAYRCFCSDQDLTEERRRCESLGIPYIYDGKCRGLSADQIDCAIKDNLSYSIRFFVNKEKYGKNGIVSFFDLVKKEVRLDLNLIGDFIIRKSDGSATYNFASVVDDVSMEITHVLRGDDHLSNTSRQVILYEALGQSLPKFAHIAMILDEKKQKLSKRDGAVSVLDFAELGYYPDAMINHLALLGWSPEDGVEVISREKLEKSFGLMKFSSAPAVFHKDKLDYLNGLYIRNLPKDDFLCDAKKFLCRFSEKKNNEAMAKYLEDKKIDEILLAVRGYCKKLSDLPKILHSFFCPSKDFSPHLLQWINNEAACSLFVLAQDYFSEKMTEFIDPEEFKLFVEKAKKELSFFGKNFFMAMRVCLMKDDSGIELDLYFSLVCREIILERFSEMTKKEF